MKMYKLINLLVVICLSNSCRSVVTTTLEVDIFEKTVNKTPEPQLIDVRTPAEYANGHLPGAILIDVKEATFVSLIKELDNSRPVFVYCRSGRRSLEAAKILEKQGFKIVYNLEGGIISWKEKGKAVEI